MPMNPRHSGTQAGITMIEVLVAVLVLGIGLLGVAGLQSLSLKNTTDVYFEQQAQSHGQELFNRIMANGNAAADGRYADEPPASEPSPDCDAEICTGPQMAAWDLWQWQDGLTRNGGAPPSATANVSWLAAFGEYQVAITWDATGAGADYAAPTCTATNNVAPGCYFAAYRLR